MTVIRHDWTREEIEEIYSKSFLDLIFEAQSIHRCHFIAGEIQKSALLSIKTGGCSENCCYCSQSARYSTDVEKEELLHPDEVVARAREAKESGSTRFCMGAAWKQIREGSDFETVLEMVRRVSDLNMEVCCSLGMLTESQANRLARAGLNYYNHNLETSPEYYEKIVSTHSFKDRLQTLQNVRQAGIKICCGGIIGLGEGRADRIGLLHSLVQQNPHPESVPINRLVPIEGTPLACHKTIDTIELIRTIATARILMPRSFVRLSAGRGALSDEAQALAFLAGANSIFSGGKLLTTPNRELNEDQKLFAKLGLREMPTQEEK